MEVEHLIHHNPYLPFAEEKVSIDYHEVLTTERGKELARRLITEGYDVHVISAGEDKTPFAETLAEIGIPMSKAHATGSNKAKVELIKKLGITKHYDNVGGVIEQLFRGNIKHHQHKFEEYKLIHFLYQN